MIIFNLDGTLADCEHRRHFVDPSYRDDCYCHFPATLEQSEGWFYNDVFLMSDPPKAKKFVPDWHSFYDACDKDDPIESVIEIWNDKISLGMMGSHQIWSGRCESVRDKTEKWLYKHLICFQPNQLKMRPIGDNTADDVLKERWLNERCADLITAQIEGRNPSGHDIDFVFDDRPKVIRMWRRRGIFVFNCCQHDGEF